MDEESKYLKFYKECMGSGRIPGCGLCWSFDMEMFKPTHEELYELLLNMGAAGFWGSGLTINDQFEDRMGKFTPLRQTIVLFMHEMTINR